MTLQWKNNKKKKAFGMIMMICSNPNFFMIDAFFVWNKIPTRMYGGGGCSYPMMGWRRRQQQQQQFQQQQQRRLKHAISKSRDNNNNSRIIQSKITDDDDDDDDNNNEEEKANKETTDDEENEEEEEENFSKLFGDVVNKELAIDNESLYETSNSDIERQTMDWIRNIVIGLNLCPFAERPLSNNNLHIQIVRGSDISIIAANLYNELIYRLYHHGTTIVVTPECYPDNFIHFLSVFEFIEEQVLRRDVDLKDQLQMVSFHPLFQFQTTTTTTTTNDDDDNDDNNNNNHNNNDDNDNNNNDDDNDGSQSSVDNMTNRSPYPMFHILREDEVSLAVDQLGGDASKVWKRNVDLLQDMEQHFGRSCLNDMLLHGQNIQTLKDYYLRYKIKSTQMKEKEEKN